MPLYDALQKTVNEIATKKSATLLQQGTGPGYPYSEPSTSTANQSEFYETVDQTRSSGAVEKFKYFNLRGEGTREIKKFKAQSRYINFNFKSVNEEETNPIVWLQNAFDELLGYIMNRMEPSDRVGMTLRNQNYPDKPVGFSFRRADQYSTEVVINIISNIMQSNADFFTRDMMTLQVDRVSLPVGKGRTNLTGSSFDEFCRKKHGIIEINNKDNLCLAYALVLAIAFKLNNSELKEMRRGSNILKQRSRQLCLRANVDLTNGGGYDEIDRFQNYLTNFTIVVYNSRLGKTTYYEGPRTESRTGLNLLMEDGHYATITSLTSAFTTSYFCELCKNRTSNKVGHAYCYYKCPCCQKNPPCNFAEQKLLCVICNRDFRGVECFNNHKKKLCLILRRCKECSASFWINKKQNHMCGWKMCRVCMKIQPIRHLCYISKNDKKKSSEAEQKFLLIFYDFERRQETPVSGVMNGFLHEPNLCISQHVCYKCFNDDSVKGSCQNCGSRVHVFKEKPVDSFLQYITLMAKNFKVTALAHNMRGYDGCFILKNIIQNRSKWNPKLITNGTKLISITCNKIRFLDSLNFLPLPLSKLPQTFNFPGSKGYFPYLFNTLENQNYVGEIPEVHYYCPDQLNSKDREALLIWHAN